MKYVKISKILTEKKKPQHKPEKASLARLLQSCNRGWAWEGRISVICSSIHSKASFPGVSKFYVSCLSLFLPSPTPHSIPCHAFLKEIVCENTY